MQDSQVAIEYHTYGRQRWNMSLGRYLGQLLTFFVILPMVCSVIWCRELGIPGWWTKVGPMVVLLLAILSLGLQLHAYRKNLKDEPVGR